MKKIIKLSITLNILLILIIFAIITLDQVKAVKNKIESNKQETLLVDKIPPVITLTGEDLTITQNTVYTEPGYIAIDNLDGNITSNVKTTNNIDTSVPGLYEITYEVTDTSSNTTRAIRKVTVEKKKIERKKTYLTTQTSNEEINNYIANLNNYLKDYKVSVGYINLNNEFTYVYNGNKEYFGASLIKVTDAMYIYEKNLLDNTTKKQVRDAISVSSNYAHSYLVKRIGKSNLTKYIKDISFRTPQCNSGFYCQTTVHDQLSYWIYLYYLFEEHPNGEELKAYFINKVGNHLSFTLDFDNLHKYGSSDTYYHDVGMFYNEENKYIIVVLSNELGTYPKHIKYLFREISKRVSQLNDLVETNY